MRTFYARPQGLRESSVLPDRRSVYTGPTVRRIFMLLLVAWVGSAATAGADVTLTFRDGHVTINASNATVAEILEQWAKVGHTQIVDGDKVTAESIDVDLTDVPEMHALDFILGSVAGFIAMSDGAMVGDRSQFDRIVILPTSTPPAEAALTEPFPVSHDSKRSEYQQYFQPEDYPASPPDPDTELVELAIPNPTGAPNSHYPASAPSAPANAWPASPAASPIPFGATVPGMPAQITPKPLPPYRTYTLQVPQN